ncbi:MAG TPA: PilZ domain-containing protein [Gemmataceae bacterium]|jgi:hypothetical protein|nr:PilZ domain-containing protein [Gemmataceae bacterium]
MMNKPVPCPEAGPPEVERRETPRRRKQIKVLVTDAEGTAEPANAWVIDRSEGGLCLSVAQEAAPGTMLGVRPAGAAPEIPWVAVEVKSCRPVENTWELGCQFLRTPSHSVLMLFG